MQSLCLDVKVLDINQQEIDLKQNFDDEDPMPSHDSFADEDTADTTSYSDGDIGDAGFSMDGEDEDGDDLDLDLEEGDDVFSFDDDDDESDLALGDDDEDGDNLYDSLDFDDSSDED